MHHADTFYADLSLFPDKQTDGAGLSGLEHLLLLCEAIIRQLQNVTVTIKDITEQHILGVAHGASYR